MGAETNKIDLVCVGIKPYQKKISFDMTFEMTGIVSGKPVRTVLNAINLAECQQSDNVRGIPQRMYRFRRLSRAFSQTFRAQRTKLMALGTVLIRNRLFVFQFF